MFLFPRESLIKNASEKKRKKKKEITCAKNERKKYALVALSLVEEKGRFCVLPHGSGAEEKNGRERFVGCDCQ